MKIKSFLKLAGKKAEKINRKAKNPFMEYNFDYNPFMSAIEQTYIWVEKENKIKP